MSRLTQRLGLDRWRGGRALDLDGILCGLALTASVAAAPQAVPAAQPVPTSPSGQTQTADLIDSEPLAVYAYDPEGRRDPFVSLLSRGTSLRPPTERPPGLAGLSINEVTLRGIVASAGEYLAVMQSPDNRTYILHGDEQLFDAVVKTITAEGVVFLQEVNDPLSLVNEREVLRTLHGQEDGR